MQPLTLKDVYKSVTQNLHNMKIKTLKTITITCLTIFSLVFSTFSQEKLDLPTFERIHMGVAGEVNLRQGNTTEVTIEASEKVKENLDIYVRGDKLYITNKNKNWNWKNWNNNDDLVVNITIQKLEAIKVSSSGRVRGKGTIKANDLELSVSGSGRIFLDTEADELESSISGSGRIEIEGSSSYNDVSISGSGRYLAENLEAEEYYVSISGSGNCKINVSKKIDARVSGSGRIYYKGDPDKINSKVSGSGSVKRL